MWLVANLFLHDDRVNAVNGSTEGRHGIAQGDLRCRLVGECAVAIAIPAVIWGWGKVNARDEDDADQRGYNAHKFPDSEFFDAGDGAKYHGPNAWDSWLVWMRRTRLNLLHTTGRGDNCSASHTRML